MRILVAGEAENLSECREKFGPAHEYRQILNSQRISDTEIDVVFDFAPGLTATDRYDPIPDVPVFLDASKSSVHAMKARLSLGDRAVFGFAGLPGFLNRTILEVSMGESSHESKLEELCKAFGTEYQLVADRAGLVTPRVICMIINEAYYACDEKTATREDIDLAMKLGTAYPLGPFEWCSKIGIRHVYEVLKAVAFETGGKRYGISSLLEQEYRARRSGAVEPRFQR